jgi:hypothetical protein
VIVGMVLSSRQASLLLDLPGLTIVRLPKKLVLDLTINVMQPLLRSFAFFVASLRLSFQFAYPLFCRAKLMREFLRHVDGLSTVGLSNPGRLVQQLNNVLPRGVELIRTIRLPAVRKWDCVAHTSPRSTWTPSRPQRCAPC